MKIYTKTGDKGQTGLLRGGRVAKHHPRVEAYGTLDELNAWIGHVRALTEDDAVEEALVRLQSGLHVSCSDAAAPFGGAEESKRLPRVRAEDVEALERGIDRLDEELPPLKRFILPGGGRVGSALHVARTICRRAERRLTELDEGEGGVNPELIRYINRLSDYLFTLARWANHREGSPEIPWTAVGEQPD